MNDKAISLTMPTSLYEKIYKMALAKNLSVAAFIRLAMTERVESGAK